MASVQFSDIIEPTRFAQYTFEKATDNDTLLTSGIVVEDEQLNDNLSGGGATWHQPNWNPITRGGWDIPDDSDNDIVPVAIDAKDMIVRRLAFTKAYEAADFVASIAGADPMDEMSREVANDVNIQKQAILISQLRGITADNIANHGGDMITDLSSLAGDAGKVSGTAIINARYTMGDYADKLNILAVHSVVANRLRILDQNNYIPASKTNIGFDTYMGFRLLITDMMPVLSGKYYSYLFAPNVVKHGQGGKLKPVSVERDEKKARGGGKEVLVVRRELAYCPLGYSYVGIPQTRKTPTLDEMQDAASWTRLYARKNIPFAVLVTNG